jgi:hypothetical protein
MKPRSWAVAAALFTFALVAAACAPLVDASQPAAGSTQAPAVVEEAAVDFTPTDAEEEGYWYSRYNLGNLVFRSGLGDAFMPDMAMVQQLIQMADANPDDGDTVTPPVNATLLQSIYASGDPHFTTQMDPADFATQRWDPATFDTTVTARAMGWTMIKESEWAKQFHVDDHFGTADADFGAYWRFVGLMLNAETKMQAKFAMENLKNDEGLYVDSDGNLDWAGQWVMLEALSDLSDLLAAENAPNSATNRYLNPDLAAQMMGATDMLFQALSARTPEGIEELSLATQALTWYAATTGDADAKAQATDLIGQFGDALAAGEPSNASETALTIRGLMEAQRVSGDVKYLDAATQAFDALAADYDAESGVFSSQNVYTIDNVAVIMGALNSLKFNAGDAVDQDQVEEIFTRFYENAVNRSGLQQAVPPLKVAKSAFEQEEPALYYGYPTVPMPPMAGGEFGIAPVFATEVTWDGGSWSVTDGDFDSAGAMHASNEFIWFHNDEVNGFPVVRE